MMIPDYDNDVKMAELGRNTAKWKAVRKARESIRDLAVMIGNSNDVQEIANYRITLNLQLTALTDALSTGKPIVSELSE